MKADPAPAATPKPSATPLKPHQTPSRSGLPQSKATSMTRVEPSGSKYIQTLSCLKKILQPYDFDGLTFDQIAGKLDGIVPRDELFITMEEMKQQGVLGKGSKFNSYIML